MEAFPLPLITLTKGAWTCDIADPRENPLALGARFIHGGYIAGLCYGERPIVNRAINQWDPYYGQGLPEAFDEPLGFAAAQSGDAFLRIGSGICERTSASRHDKSDLLRGVEWKLSEQGSDYCVWRCSDQLLIGGAAYAYDFERRIILTDDGLISSSSLSTTCPWSEPLTWFPHPYIAQGTGSGCGLHLPEHAFINNQQLGIKTWRGNDTDIEFGVVSGLWGHQSGIAIELDPTCGGGGIDMRLDRPIDKIVCWANQQSFAAEPYWSHAWSNGERAQWTLTYRFHFE